MSGLVFSPFVCFYDGVSANSPAPKTVNILASAEELAQFLQENPDAIEKELFNQGEAMIGVFQDETMRDTFKGFGPKKIEALKLAIEDLASGGDILRSSTIGLVYKDNQFSTYQTPFGTPPSGNVVFSLNLKNVAAFKNWRSGSGEAELPQEEAHTAIYFLTALWSRLLQG